MTTFKRHPSHNGDGGAREKWTTASRLLFALVPTFGCAALLGATISCRATGERSSVNKATEHAAVGSTLPKALSRSPRSVPSPTVAQPESDYAVAGSPESMGGLRPALGELTWSFNDASLGRIDVVVVLPDRKPDQRFPLLVALHGRGEAMKGPARGARGWVDDYALVRAMQRLSAPPLVPSDFEGIVSTQRLATLNEALEREPYRGLVVVCPYTPDLLSGDKPFESVRPYTRFIVEQLLPRAKRELPIVGTPDSTGIDGVSLGGRVGFLTGLFAAEHFRTVAGLQAAFDSEDAVALGRLGDDAFRRNRRIRFRLLTSDRDYFIQANHAIAAEFQQRRLPMQLRLIPGPHDYIFNRGPGSIEMLFFHDRALRRDAWPE